MHEASAEYGQAHIEIYPDRITLDSGRPVITFPAGYSGKLTGRHVVVAWDGGRAAARALADAMQILASDDAIEIVSVGRLPLAQTLPDFDVRMVFERHGLSVSLTELPRDRRSIADTLVDHCEKVGAGLLVMGAYEHSPLREGLIGGVTHDIAMRAKIPVLMSH
jgi:nucleotide-binding universal stress UspA family protein